ncbi:hypothetical protein SAMN06295974_1317 [Plantibacter flavus]|uniref:DUF3800 domain-containing protein n=1 Tax=Plantibacter flavus TaxID=150123 RepID=A0A3N2C6W0_9MICO|nr:hypothetical protein [Plantibacter flavus]ROR83251.1 hypothetical protein EDD42_3361 [Plantibacter flavus]SMG21921.1 hypothetical protein SAMN06295974_1317 [Plantibacter flavus]
MNDESPRRTEGISVFLDESGTHHGAEVVLAGAVVTPHAALMEAQVVAAAHDAIADPALWPTFEKMTAFERSGFHYSADQPSTRDQFLLAMRRMDYRAHVAFSRHASGVEGVELLVNMYYTLVRNILLRYRTEVIVFAFEEESRMNSLYSRIVGAARDDVANTLGLRVDATAVRANKRAPILGVVDYVLAVAGHALATQPKAYEVGRFNRGLPAHLAHLIDFDRAVHRSSRKGIELL